MPRRLLTAGVIRRSSGPVAAGVVVAVAAAAPGVLAWPAGGYVVHPARGRESARPFGPFVVAPCRCGLAWTLDGPPGDGGAVDGCGCEYGAGAVSALERLWRAAVAVSGGAVQW